mgnify:CR=1 FL=1
MHWEALKKTFTPTGSFPNAILTMTAITIGILVFITVVVVVLFAIHFGLIWAFGAGATIVEWCLVGAFWFWALIGEPLYERYLRIKNEITYS